MRCKRPCGLADVVNFGFIADSGLDYGKTTRQLSTSFSAFVYNILDSRKATACVSVVISSITFHKHNSNFTAVREFAASHSLMVSSLRR